VPSLNIIEFWGDFLKELQFKDRIARELMDIESMSPCIRFPFSGTHLLFEDAGKSITRMDYFNQSGFYSAGNCPPYHGTAVGGRSQRIGSIRCIHHRKSSGGARMVRRIEMKWGLPWAYLFVPEVLFSGFSSLLL
jgi:hypothetical protein